MTTLCSGAALWKVYADIPQESPPLIRVDWNDGSAINEIEGDDYKLTETSLTSEGILYDVTVYYTWNQTGEVSSKTFFQVPGPINEPGTYNAGNPQSSYGVKYAGKKATTDYGKYPYITWAYGRYYPLMVLSANYLFGVAWDGVWYWVVNKVIAKRSADQGENTGYNLKIYRSSELVYDETKETNPTVEKFDAGCRYQNKWKSYYQEINLQPNAYLKVEYQGKKAILSKCEMPDSGSFQSNQCQMVKQIKGTCDKPLFKATSEPLCPRGTCELSCRGSLCCYNQYGIAVKSYAGAVV